MRLKKAVMFGTIATALVFAAAPICHAIDNPDAPDWVADFEARSAQFDHIIYQQAQNQIEINQAYARYSEFLDQSLNQAYTRLSEQLDQDNKQALKHSQRLWLQFRDAEFDFINHNWTPANFGSSSALSRNAYRVKVVKSRVLELLHYLKNYPDSESAR